MTAAVSVMPAPGPGRRATIIPMFWTLPTILTWTRIVAIPLIVGVFYLPLAPDGAIRSRH